MGDNLLFFFFFFFTGWFMASWWSYLCTLMHHYPTAHTLSELSIHRYYKDLLPCHSCSPVSPFYLSRAHLHTVTHTHACTFFPMNSNPLKAHSSHTHIIQVYPSLRLLLVFLLLSLPATLPLGSMSRNGLKELAPCTWSALFTRTCMWAESTVEDSLRAHRVHLRSGRVRQAFCLSAHTHIKSGLIYS